MIGCKVNGANLHESIRVWQFHLIYFFNHTEQNSQPLTFASCFTLVLSVEPVLVAPTASIDELLTPAGGGIVMVTWKVKLDTCRSQGEGHKDQRRSKDILQRNENSTHGLQRPNSLTASWYFLVDAILNGLTATHGEHVSFPSPEVEDFNQPIAKRELSA